MLIIGIIMASAIAAVMIINSLTTAVIKLRKKAESESYRLIYDSVTGDILEFEAWLAKRRIDSTCENLIGDDD